MGAQSEYIIPYLGLSNGIHQYDFSLNNQFFVNFEKSKIKDANIELSVNFEKRDRMVVLEITGGGSFRSSCDRCLAEIDIPIQFDDRIIIKFADQKHPSDSEEVYYLDPKTSHVDISPYIYEVVHLHLPIVNARNCEEEGFVYCDQTVLSAIQTENDKNQSSFEDESPWSELRKLNLE